MAINKKEQIKTLKLSLANEEMILKWSYGEIKKSETINYKTLKPEPEGLFDEKIFGPCKDYSCACGKYHNIKFRGRRCEKCGVEVISSIVRRERMGHIKLECPVAHTWYIKESPNPSKIAMVLDMGREIEEVIYFVHYIVLESPTVCQKYFKKKDVINFSSVKESRTNRGLIRRLLKSEILPKLKAGSVDYERANEYYDRLRDSDLPFDIYEIFNFITKHTGIRFGIGAEAIKELLQEVDIKTEVEKIKKQINPSHSSFTKLLARLQVLNWFLESNNKPEWMILTVIPVIPPESRPIIQLDSGNFTTSDVNDLYRRIIIRNERLHRMIEQNSPSVIINNEKHMIQEAVDSLFDNSARGNKRFKNKDFTPLKSLSDKLKGKEGLFRKNLLGKRVDYSARSVIVGGPELKLYEAGVPVDIILKIFRPFIIADLIKKTDDDGNEITPIAQNIKIAEKILFEQQDIIWPIVQNIIKDRPILLNRAPTLHRLGILAFEIKMIEGKAIQLHPLCCSGFNADFDGDTMAIHLPLSPEAIAEARELMLATKNIITPKDGRPTITPTIDMLVGVYYLTTERNNGKGEGIIFSTISEVIRAYEDDIVAFDAIVGISSNNYTNKQIPANKIVVTTVGKIIFNSILPNDFTFVNNGQKLFGLASNDFLPENTNIADFIKESYILKESISKKELNQIIFQLFKTYDYNIVAKTADAIKEIGFKYATKSGISFSYFDLPKNIDDKKDESISAALQDVKKYKNQYRNGLLTDDERYLRVIKRWKDVKDNVTKLVQQYLVDPKNNSDNIVIMSRSGARGNTDQLTQMVGMRGLMAKTFDYGRKTKSLIIRDSIESPVISSFKSGMKISEFFNASYGARKAISDVQMKTSKSGYMTRKLVDVAQEVIVTEDDCGSYTGIVVTPIMNDDGQILESLSSRISGRYSVSDVVDNSGNVLVKGGELISEDIAEKIEKSGVESVEIRSILHCNCKHGVCRKCYGTDLTTGKDVNLYTPVGVVAAQSIGEPITQINLRSFHSGGVAGGPQIAQGYERIVQLLELIPPKDYETAIIAPISGKILSINDIKDEDSDLIKYKEVQIQNDIETVSVHVYHNAYMIVKVGQDVVIGDKLNSGSINLHDLLIIKGIETVKHYIINEVQKMYLYQGIKINDKYMEIIINQMTNRVCISNSGDSNLLIGDTITINQLSEINDELLSNHKNPANATPILISLPNIPAKSDSFLAAASFQYTKRVLISAAIRNQVDNLQTLKENVILGKLIPAGSGNAKPEEIIANGFRTRKDEY